MSSKRIFFVLIGLIVLLSGLGIGSVVLGSNLFRQQSAKLIDLKLEDALIEEQRRLLSQAKKDIEELADLNAVAQSVVPRDKDQARTVREISNIAAASNIPLKQFQFPTSSLGQSRTSSESGSNAAPSSITQVKPVKGLSGVYSMEIVVQQDTEGPRSFNDIIRFLEGLENNRRTAHVKKISLQPGSSGNLLLTLTLEVYVKP